MRYLLNSEMGWGWPFSVEVPLTPLRKIEKVGLIF